MNAVDSGIHTKLTSDNVGAGNLMSLVTGVFRILAPQEQTPPYVIYQEMSKVDSYVLSGRAYQRLIYLLKVIDQNTNAATVETALDRIDVLLNDQTLTLTPYTQMYCRRQGSMPPFVETDQGVTYQQVGALYEIFLR